MRSLIPLAVVLALPLAACGGDDSPEAASSTEAVALEVRVLPETTTRSSVTVRGTVTEGSRVTADGEPAKVDGNRFAATVPLAPGKNRIALIATRPGRQAAHRIVAIIREELRIEEPPPTVAPVPAEPAPPPGGVPQGPTP